MSNDTYWARLKGTHLRSQEEIVAKFQESQGKFLNFEGEVLLPFLDFEHARPLLKPETPETEWEKARSPLTKEQILIEMKDYMSVAWGKVEDHRSISAGRSVDKLSAYVWLLGDDDTLARVEEAGYAQYGAPKLAVICGVYDLDIPEDEGVQRMIQGENCGSHDGCGCGS